MKIEYVFKHWKDGDIQKEIFDIEEVEKGKSLDYATWMGKDGYTLINRVVINQRVK